MSKYPFPHISRSALFIGALSLTPSVFALGPYSIGTKVTGPSSSANFGFSVSAARRTPPGGDAVAIVSGFTGNAQIFTMPFNNAGQTGLVGLGSVLSSGVADDLFGFTSAINGFNGGTIALVGAVGDDAGQANTNFNAGKVYVYTAGARGAPFSATATIAPPVITETGNFGHSLAISETEIAIGEPKAKNANVEVGAVHIYRFIAGTWVLQTSIFGTDTGARFGDQVAFSGSTLIIGAPLDDAAVTEAGAVYVYTGAANSWSLQARLTASDAATQDRFGLSVAVFEDTLVVGAANDDKAAGSNAGSVYAFVRNAGTWSEQQKIRSTSPRPDERFGQSISLERNELLVGAYCEAGAGCAGSVYQFRRSAGAWNFETVYTDAAGLAGDRFARSISHGNGSSAIIGAFGASVFQGAAYPLIGNAILADGFED